MMATKPYLSKEMFKSTPMTELLQGILSEKLPQDRAKGEKDYKQEITKRDISISSKVLGIKPTAHTNILWGLSTTKPS